MSVWEPIQTGYSLKQAVEAFLGDKTNYHTRSYYAKHLRKLVDYLGGGRDLGHVLPADLRIHTNSLPDTWSPVTRSNYKLTIKIFFNWWVKDMQVLPHSPAQGLKIRRPKKTVNKDDAINEADLAILVEHVRWNDATPRGLAIVLFSADAAPRANDLSKLQWGDVDIDRGVAVFREGKGDKERWAAFGPKAKAALQRWRTYIEKKHGHPPLPEWYVWNRNGKQIKSANISQMLSRLCADAGIRQDRERYKRNGAHMFRHRKGFQGAEQKMPPPTVAAMLGHEDVTVTMENYYPRGWWTAEPAMRRLAYGAESEPRLIEIKPDSGQNKSQ
jgi:integrase